MKLANIVSTSKLSVSTEFNVVKTMADIIHGLPTLIVGYEYVNKHFPEFDITNPCLDSNIYWIFKKSENRDKHSEGLHWFVNKIYSDLTSKTDYIFVDPIQYSVKKLRKIIRKIYSIKNKIAYVYGEMIYIYGENLTFGIDLKLLRYMGINVLKIKAKIKEITDVFLEDEQILIEYKKNVGMLGYQVRDIPYIHSITYEQNDSTSLIHIPRTN
jgi:hypothetical protein